MPGNLIAAVSVAPSGPQRGPVPLGACTEHRGAQHGRVGRPEPVRLGEAAPSLELARSAKRQGAAIFFVTGRPDVLRALTQANLERVGYPVDGLYLHPVLDLEPVGTVKIRARTAIEKKGYTIVANIGNRNSDLTGGHAERTFKLPDYQGLLG
ncbi:HAD family acid phosphatase [Amycolatopsis halotolerans]|uniref:HAD family acid phosphatase n=1 Tax=Amycolatopsis halotolerans TaxID=330083 RepID=A0ABV7QAX6_9PSEU